MFNAASCCFSQDVAADSSVDVHDTMTHERSETLDGPRLFDRARACTFERVSCRGLPLVTLVRNN